MDQRAHFPHEEMSNRLEIALEAQHHAVHHTMAVDPTPGDKIPGRPASSRPAGLTFRPIGPNQVGGYSNRHCKEEYWVFDQKSVDQEAGRLDIFTPCAHPSHGSQATEVPAYKPRIGSSTDLQSTRNSSPHLTSKARRIEASLRRSVALLIS